MDRGQGVEEAVPGFAPFVADPELAGCCAEVEGW